MKKTVETVAENELDLLGKTGGYHHKGNRVRRADVLAFILSVVAAIFLWFYVMSVESPTTEMDFFGVQVEYRGDYELQSAMGLSLISEENNTIDIVLRGKKSTLNRMTSEDITAYVDLSQIHESGQNELTVEYQLPEGITCITQNSIQVEVDALISKKVPIEVDLSNYSYETDYVIGDPTLSVEELAITGPASLVSKIEKAKAVLDLENQKLTESLSAMVTPLLFDGENSEIRSNYLKLSTDTVSVKIPVYLYKDVDLTVTYKYGYFTEENTTVTISPSTVRIKGEPSVIQNIDSVSLGEIDETTIYDDASMNLSLQLPTGATSVDGITSAIVVLQHVGTSVKTVTIQNITANGSEGKNYRILTSSLDISLRCKTDVFNSIDQSSITASIDLSSVGNLTGQIEKKVTINYTGTGKDNAYTLGEYTVTVELLPATSG